jgi:hypothetical protein
MNMESFVMPAWMAGIQMRRMRPETSTSAWIPALHAGMTESRSRTTDRGPLPLVFSTESTTAIMETWELFARSFAIFVLGDGVKFFSSL